MKRLFTLTFLILISWSSFSQTTTNTDTTYWGISLYGSADYNMQLIKGSTTAGQDGAFMNNLSLPRIGYLLGFSINRPVSKRLSMEFGVSFQSQGYRLGTLSDTLWNYRDSAIGFNDYEKACRYYSINIPVLLKITLFHIKKVKFDLGLGVAPVISLGKQQVSVFDNHTEKFHEKSGRDIDVQALGCLSVYIPLSKNISLSLEPTFRYNILPYKDNYYEGVSRNMMSAGLGIYLTYKLTDDEMYDYYYRHIYHNKNLPPAF
ncbi:MAG TPA: outer membrane beta-barrel protein [Bacteroidales bacterium]|nr:outer membrane beta-barrel protein [Bacteroidales bacterium]